MSLSKVCGFFIFFCLAPALANSPVLALDAPAWQALRQQIRETRSFRLGVPSQIQVVGDGSTVIFHRAAAPSTEMQIFELDLKSGQEKKILDAGMLLAGNGKVSAEEKALRERLRLQTSGLNFSLVDLKGERIVVPFQGKLFVYTRKSGTVKEIAKGDGPIFSPKLSPDGVWVAYVRRSNLYVARLDGGIEQALTRGGTETHSYGVAEFIAQEELDRRDGFWWSPDSRTLLLQEVDQKGVEQLVISDPAKPDAEPQRPFYPRAGRNNVKSRFGFISILGGDPRWIHFGQLTFEYVAGVNWDQDKPTLQLLDREQKTAFLVLADPLSLKTEVLVKQDDPAWLELDVNLPEWLSKNQGFIWLSSNRGQDVLEWRDPQGKVVKPLTSPDFAYQQWVGLDSQKKKAFVLASKRPETSALYAIDLETGEARLVQELEGGQVSAQAIKRSDLYVLRKTSLQGEDLIELRSFDGKQVFPLRNLTPTPLLKAQVRIEEVGRDQVRVAIVRPSSFDPQRKYPLIENAYGGPGNQMVRSSGRAYLADQTIADALDVIVVRMDTRGTPGRGRAWERAIAGKFGSLPVDEHAEVLKNLVERFPEMDGQKIGVFGWSYGGYFAAYAALARPDVYKAAVVGAPPVDWLDYDTAYTERYMGLPQSKKADYETASLLNVLRKSGAHRKSPLLLIHGSADDNVYFFNSLKLVDALERADYPYEFMPLIGMTHMVTDPILDDKRFERTLKFFRKHLIGESTDRS